MTQHTPGPIVCTCGGGLDTRVYHDFKCPIRLIAAAPEMLALLTRVAARDQRLSVHEIHALLAKIEGKE